METLEATINDSELLTNITKRAMLATLKVHKPEFVRVDKNMSRESANAHNASVSLITTSKRLIKKEFMAQYVSIAGEIGEKHKKYTLPWKSNGTRILSQANLQKYNDVMEELADKFNRAADEFCANYQSYRIQSLADLGTSASVADYPLATEVRDLFKVSIDIDPMPSEQDFRVELGEAEIKRIQEGMSRKNAEWVRKSIQDPLERIKSVIGNMRDRLVLYESKVAADIKGNKDSFKDSLITNIQELAEVLPGLNLMGDSNLDSLINEIQVLASINPDSLRDKGGSGIREAAIKAGDSLLSRVDDLMAAIY